MRRTTATAETTAATIAQIFAFREDDTAPAKSPDCHLPLTCAAYTIDTIPAGRKQNRVARMAHTR
jgi:hypothetical protein